jgi:hypothetical protein
MNLKEEYIICSAVHYDDGIVYQEQPMNIKTGIVVAGRRHNNCFYSLKQMSLYDESKVTRENTISGFLTNFDNFLNREEAFKLAEKNNQLLIPELHHKTNSDILFLGKFGEHKNILTSEDLYPYNDAEMKK